MARKQEPVRPLYPTKHEYDASLKAVLDAASMLHIAADTAFKLAKTPDAALRCLQDLKPHLEAYRLAVYGE